jgi:hypothetical protein
MGIRHILLCGIMVIAVGCPATKQVRLAPESSDPVARIAEQHDRGNGHVAMWRVDGQSVREHDARDRFKLEVDVPPGRHEVECSFESPRIRSSGNAVLAFAAEPGERYTVKARHVKQGFWSELGKQFRTSMLPLSPAKASWIAWIEDSSGTVVAGARPTREGLFRTELPDASGSVATHPGWHTYDPPPMPVYIPRPMSGSR